MNPQTHSKHPPLTLPNAGEASFENERNFFFGAPILDIFVLPMGRNATPLKPAKFSPMLHEECPSRISRLRFCILASAFLTSLAILAVTTSSSGGKLNNLEVLQTQLREYGGLAKERRALEQKRAFLNNMIAHGISDSDYASASQQLHRALESKVRLLAKFEEESNQTPRSGYLQDHELSQKASNPEGEDDGWHMHEIGYSDVDGEAQHAPVLNEHTPPPPLQQIETPEGSLEKKHLSLTTFLRMQHLSSDPRRAQDTMPPKLLI
jgi:hypothetical protein